MTNLLPTPSRLSLSSNSQFTPQNPLKLHYSHSSRPSLPTKFFLLPVLCSKSTNSPAPSLRWVPEWADAVKERGKRKRRALYTPDDWRAHRSSSRHFRHLLSSLSSRVILSLVPPVFSLTAVAAALALYNSAVSLAWLPDFFPLLRASSLPYQLTAPALALLLVFRTEASYSRFVEGRKAWMKVVAGANELAGMVMSVRGNNCGADAGVRRDLLNYIMAFPVALKVGGDPFAAYIRD
ncbi:putative UPF0187 protein, chloroplastic [Cocos nucifera]|uniref:Putative UPF0187 protein, chloroplastic n=1 Tax=Cocos nucifera TaxID=13894 RepID=A0A8K0IGH9_COCNU|nr:putative UPF0187 protein, chloroplastic [Cocos nucifera]